MTIKNDLLNNSLLKELNNNPRIIESAIEHGVPLSLEMVLFYIDSLKEKDKYESLSYLPEMHSIETMSDSEKIYQKILNIFNELPTGLHDTESRYLRYKIEFYDALHRRCFKLHKKTDLKKERIQKHIDFYVKTINDETYLPCLMLAHDYLRSDAKSKNHHGHQLMLKLTDQLSQEALKKSNIYYFIKHYPEIVYDIDADLCLNLFKYAIEYINEYPLIFKSEDIREFLGLLIQNKNCPASVLLGIESRSKEQSLLIKEIKKHPNYKNIATAILENLNA